MIEQITTKKMDLNVYLPQPVDKWLNGHYLFLFDPWKYIINIKLGRCILWNVLHSSPVTDTYKLDAYYEETEDQYTERENSQIKFNTIELIDCKHSYDSIRKNIHGCISIR
jgi:hypothetical protein